VAPITFASVLNRSYNSTTSGGGQDRYAFRWQHILGDDMFSICLGSMNWTLQNIGKQDTGNAYTYEGVSAEANGVVVPFRWSGSTTKTINDGDNNIVSDEIFETSFGGLNKGDTVWIKGIVSVTAGDKVPMGGLDVASVTNSQSFRYVNATTTISSVTASGVFTTTGVAPTQVGNAHSPVLLGRSYNADILSYIGVGDSIIVLPVSGSTKGAYGDGFFFQSIQDGSNGDLHPGMAWGTSGVGTGAYINNFWSAWAVYANRGIVQLLTNNVNNQTVGTMQGGIQGDVWNKLTSNGVDKILHVGLMTATNTTDDWITSANQTPQTHWELGGRAQQMNAWFPTRVGSNITAFCDLSSMMEPLDATIWLTNGTPDYMTYDGLHPSYYESGNSIGYQTMIPLVRAARVSMG